MGKKLAKEEKNSVEFLQNLGLIDTKSKEVKKQKKDN